jgi:exodeoxyribonuclease VII large subunit
MQVLCRGGVDVYPQRGTYQLIVRNIQPLGQGSLQIAFRKLHDRLKQEGLFDDEHKKPIPRFARRVAVITSPTGAAIHDFLQVATRRWPHFDFLIIPTPVQGDGAAKQIARAIQLCGRKKFAFRPEAIILTRGGGSIEDLWSFNEEVVVRAIHKCSIPIISGVGHEIDVTLADLAADCRALTPSEAGEIIASDVSEVSNFLGNCGLRMHNAIRHNLRHCRSNLENTVHRPAIRQPLNQIRNLSLQVDSLETKLAQMSIRRFENTRQYLDRCREKLVMTLQSSIPTARFRLQRLLDTPALAKPLTPIQQKREQLARLQQRLIDTMNRRLKSAADKVDHSGEMLNAFNPDNILSRGYSLTVNSSGKPVTDCKTVEPGDQLTTWLQKGSVSSTVNSTSPDSSYTQDGKKEN